MQNHQHLERDLQKITDDNLDHTWSDKLKKHISSTIKKRKEFISGGKPCFSEEEIKKFDAKVKRLILKGKKENGASTNTYAAPFEKAVLKRI